VNLTFKTGTGCITPRFATDWQTSVRDQRYEIETTDLISRSGFKFSFLHATAGTAIVHLSHRSSVCPFFCLSVRHMGGSVRNGAS